jgi:hypothetical protein
MSVPPANSRRLRKTFTIDYPTHFIAHFLDDTLVSSPTLTTQCDDSVRLRGLTDRYEVLKMFDHVHQRLEQNIQENGRRAMDLLLLASTRDDWAMGRAAIRKLNQRHSTSYLKNLVVTRASSTSFDQFGDKH